LRCEYLENPLGIDVLTPRLSWKIQSDGRAVMQKSYRILVASSAELLAEDSGDVWDSGLVESDQSIQVEFAGKALESKSPYFWKVQVKTPGGVEVESKTAHWSMGLLHAEDWQAEWIGFDKNPDLPSAARADLQGKGHKVVVTKALYGVKGDPTKQIDIKKQLQAQVDSGQLLVKPTNELAGKDPAHGTKKVLEYACRVDDWNVGSTVHENAVSDLTTGQPAKQYLPAPYLRKEFPVASPVKRAVLYATAQGVVELSLNGQRVGDEVFTPGWTDYRKRIYYRTYDVTELMQTGPNALGAILGDGWFRGNISCVGQNKYGNRLRLKAQLHIEYQDGRTEVIASDPSWKAAYGPILESDMQAGEVYDARREMSGWNRAGFEDDGWSPVVAGSAIKPLLQAYPGVPVRPIQELPAVQVTEPQPGTYVFDLGQNFSGWIRLKVKGEAGDKVDMLFAEMLKEDGTAYTINLRSARAVDTYILKGGEEEVWEPRFTFHGFRYVQISGLREKPAPDAVTGIVLYSDSPEASSFECSNPMVNKIYRNIVWGQRSNYLEIVRNAMNAWAGQGIPRSLFEPGAITRMCPPSSPSGWWT
jgi:alpha-L-rhamnosidase